MSDTREAFEAAMTADAEAADLNPSFIRNGDGAYAQREMQAAWRGYQAALTSAAADPAAPPNNRYFVYDPEGGSPDFYDTEAQRDEAHREAIKGYRDETILYGEWSQSVDSIVSGVVTHKTIWTNTHGDQYDFDPAPLYAAPLTREVATVPAGWKLVPTMHKGRAGLTDAMMRAFYDTWKENDPRGSFERLNSSYNALLAAAPAFPAASSNTLPRESEGATHPVYALFSSSDRRNFGHLEPQAFVDAVIAAVRAQPVADDTGAKGDAS